MTLKNRLNYSYKKTLGIGPLHISLKYPPLLYWQDHMFTSSGLQEWPHLQANLNQFLLNRNGGPGFLNWEGRRGGKRHRIQEEMFPI